MKLWRKGDEIFVTTKENGKRTDYVGSVPEEGEGGVEMRQLRQSREKKEDAKEETDE